MNKRRRVFLDHASATPLDMDVARVMARMARYYANPSALYDEAVAAHREMECARTRIAACIGAHSDEIVFTGSASESIALAHRGLWESGYVQEGDEVITTPIEHDAVFAQMQWLRACGVVIHELLVDGYGMVNPADMKKMLTPRTKLVTSIYGHNEIGTLQPIAEMGRIILAHRKQGGHALFHVDACQVMNAHVSVAVEHLHVDMMSFNSSKVYGPRGIAALYKRRAVPLSGVIVGGGHEGGLRAGTENIAGIGGFAHALEKARNLSAGEDARLGLLARRLMDGIVDGQEVVLVGHPVHRLAHHVSFALAHHDGEEFVLRLNARGIACSTKSACSTLEEGASRTIKVLALPSHYERGVIRMVLGRGTSARDIDLTIKSVREVLGFMKK